MNVDEAIEALAEADLLTERQAEAYVLRDIELAGREATAKAMGISPNTLDNTLSMARKKVSQAQATADAVEAIRHEEIPSACSECGATLGGTWSEDESGEALCFDCAGVDPEQIP